MAALVLLGACGSGTDEAGGDTGDDPVAAESSQSPAENTETGDDTSTGGSDEPSTPDDDEDGSGAGSGSDGDTGDTGDVEPDDDTTPDPEGTVSADLMARLAVGLAATSGNGLTITEADGTCVAQGLDGSLDAERYERLTLRIEANEPLESDDGFGPDEITTLSEVLARCIDFRALVDEPVDEFGVPWIEMVECIETELGPDAVEAGLLASLFADELEFSQETLLLDGLDRCPDETISHVAHVIVSGTFGVSEEDLLTCLTEVPADAYRLAVETGEITTTSAGTDLATEYCDDHLGG